MNLSIRKLLMAITVAFTVTLLLGAVNIASSCKCRGQMDHNLFQGWHNFHCLYESQACDDNQGTCQVETSPSGAKDCKCQNNSGSQNDQNCKCNLHYDSSVQYNPWCYEFDCTNAYGEDKCELVTHLTGFRFCKCPL